MDFYLKPIKFTRTLRTLIQQRLKFKIKINDKIRFYLKYPYFQKVSLDEIIEFINLNLNSKRQRIPDNMFFNKHVRRYWVSSKKKSRKHCITLWWKFKDLYYSGSGDLIDYDNLEGFSF